MSVKPINKTGDINDNDFVAISRSARKAERAHVLGLLQTHIGILKQSDMAPEDIYASLARWIEQRTCQL